MKAAGRVAALVCVTYPQAERRHRHPLPGLSTQAHLSEPRFGFISWTMSTAA